MANKRQQQQANATTVRTSLILRDCARLTAEHDRIAATYRDLAARMDQAIYKRREER